MTATKTSRTVQSSASNSAGGTTTGTTIDLSTALGATITGKITNGGTGPTVGCDFVVQVSQDGTNWYEAYRVTAGVANSAAYSFAFDLAASVMRARAVFTGNTGQAVTVESYLQELTAVA